jgi:hypothetical protein
MFGGSRGLGFTAQDEAAALATAVGGMVDLLPEADEVVNRGDDGDDGHPVDGGDGDEVDSDDEAAMEVGEQEPVVPAMGEDSSDDRDDLDDGFELADFAGFDGEAFSSGDTAETGDKKLAADDEDSDPGLDDAGVVGDEQDVGGGDHQLVGEWVEKHAHGGDLVASAGEVAVKAVSDAGKDEDDAGDDLLLAAPKAGGAVSLKGKDRREYPDEQRNGCNTAHRDGVGQVHGRFLWRNGGELRALPITSILP